MDLSKMLAFLDIAKNCHAITAEEFATKYGDYQIAFLILERFVSHYPINPEYLTLTAKGENVIKALQAVCSI